ncbi:MAG: methyltransferase domain-containing protein [Desulfuromonadales bacterium]|nr:methyltransferase domain-containing protein [Desulfuromonadales bacterium]
MDAAVARLITGRLLSRPWPCYTPPMTWHFDLISPVYDRLLPAPDPQLWMELLRLPAGRLLDAGGGTGRVAWELRRLCRQVVVADFSHRMLLQARDKEGLQPVQADVARLPFPDHRFDRALVADALHHFPDQRGAMAELLRVLAPGGRLVIEEPDLTRLPVKAVALAEKAVLMRSHFLSAEGICTLAQSCGGRASIGRRGKFLVWIIVDKPGGGESAA